MSAGIKILIVDDDESILEQMGAFLEGRGYQVVTAQDGESALTTLREKPCRVALIDYRMPGMSGLELAKRIRESYPEIVLIMMTAYGTVESAVTAMKAGVHDYLLKPIGPEQLQHKLRFVADKLQAEDELMRLRQMVREQYRFDNLIGASPSMHKVFSLLESAAQCDLPILVNGETGTGKELAARAIHFNSARRHRPFVAVNCAAVPESLIESELFGHVKGAFTGASQNRPGKLASAEGGSLLLDELSAAPESFQSRLLRVLEEKRFTPVGSDEYRSVDVRTIAASNTSPEEAVAAGRLRRDLYYRLNVIRIDLPPLRERREDIPLLVRAVLARASSGPETERPQVTLEFLDELMAWDWPGNVRELQNVIEAAMACAKGPLTVGDIPQRMRPNASGEAQQPSVRPPLLKNLKEVLAEAERAHIHNVLSHTGGNMQQTASLLGIDVRSLRRKLAKFRIERLDYRSR